MFSGGPRHSPPTGGGNGNTSSLSAHQQQQQQQEQANNKNSVVEDSADDDDIFDPNIPGFTDEEAWGEIQSLTAQEIAAVQADLIGLSTTMGALNLGGREGGRAAAAAGTAGIGRAVSAGGNAGAAIPTDTNVTARIHAEINRLPSGETAAYRQALQLCPDQVMDPRRVQMFLDYAAEEEKQQQQQQQQLPEVTAINGSNTPIAAATTSDACVRDVAQKMAKYWKVREKIFNGAHPNTAFLPMTQAGALTAAGAMNLATRRVYELLPTTDTSGRSVLYFAPHRRDYTQHTVYQDLAGFWYLLETVMEDPEKKKRGIVLLVEARHITRKHTPRGAFSGIMSLFSALPISFKACHVCYPNSLLNYVILPVMKRLAPKNFRLRLVVHYGTTNEVLTSLSGYCLPSDRVPTDLGGQLVLNSTASMLNRMAIETVRMNPSIGSLIQQNDTELQRSTTSIAAMGLISGAAGFTGARGSNIRTVQVESNNKNKEPPEVDCHPNLSDLQVYNKLMEVKKSKNKRGDPRMNQALAVCLEDAEQPHLDVLLQCGFDFSPLSREELRVAGSRDVKDVENITLKQRFDQLSRRLRIAKEWIKREREEGKLVSTSTESTEQMQTESSDNNSKINDKPECNICAGSGLNKAQKRRRDSFDEAIDELPGMEGLGDTLVDMLSDDEDLITQLRNA